MDRTKISIFLLIILALGVRLFILFSFNNNLGDSMGQVVYALSILENPNFFSNFDGNTSILYRYSLAGILYFWHNPLVSPRILSIFFGVFFIIPFYFTVRLLFNERIAFYSGFILAVYPLHAFLSTFTSSDVMFYFFFFSSLYYLFKFKFNPKNIFDLVLSISLFNIAALLRFESWLFIPIFAGMLYKTGRKYSLIFFLLSLLFPAIHIYLCYKVHRNALYTFTTPAITSRAEIMLRVHHPKQIFGWINVLYKNLGYTIVLSGMCGMVVSFFRRKNFYLALFFMVLFVTFTINSLLNRMWYNERYSLILGILIVPYFAYFVEKIANYLRLKPAVIFLPFILLSLLEFKKIYKTPSFYMPHMAFSISPKIKDLARWIGANVSPVGKIILSSDRYDAYPQDIIVRSGISPLRFRTFFTPLIHPKDIAIERFKEFMDHEKPSYLVLLSESFLEDYLRFDMNERRITRNNIAFEIIFEINLTESIKCNVYKITYSHF